MDYAWSSQIVPARNAGTSGCRVAVIGAGPAGLSCAGELARQGHSVTVFEKRPLPGGLSTYGIIGLREPMEVALEEARMIQAMGVGILGERELGANLSMADLQRQKLWVWTEQAWFTDQWKSLGVHTVNTPIYDAARTYADDVRAGTFPGPDETF